MTKKFPVPKRPDPVYGAGAHLYDLFADLSVAVGRGNIHHVSGARQFSCLHLDGFQGCGAQYQHDAGCGPGDRSGGGLWSLYREQDNGRVQGKTEFTGGGHRGSDNRWEGCFLHGYHDDRRGYFLVVLAAPVPG